MNLAATAERCKIKINDFIKRFFLPLYGRKMIIAIFASVMYLAGVHWHELAQGAKFIVDNNKYFSEGGLWFYAILAIFMGGQLIDNVTNKDDDHSRAERLTTWEYFKAKTTEIMEPRQFMIWIFVAVMFIVGVVNDEILFYFSAGYVGVNSAEALIDHFKALKTGFTGAAQGFMTENQLDQIGNNATTANPAPASTDLPASPLP